MTASETSYSDLYWALRGGGNNFGLVTKFNLYTIPSPALYGGARIFLEAQVHDVVTAWVNVANNASVDPYAQQYVAFLQSNGMNIATAELTYAKNDSSPEIYKEYRSIPAISDRSSTKTLVEYVKYLEAENPYGFREVYWPISAQMDEDFAKWVVDLWFSMIPEVLGLSGSQPVLIYQAITEPMIKNMKNHGGNPLGLEDKTIPVHLMHVAFRWNEASDDDTVYAFTNSFLEKVIAEAKALGIYDEYIYINYASLFQDAIAGYGAENKAKLKKIAKKYDPRKVYQTLQPGYFKLDGAPKTGSF